MWTFAGTLANRALARRHQAAGARGSDELSVNYRIDPRGILKDLLDTPFVLEEKETAELSSAVKFASLLPRELLVRLISARVFGQPSPKNESASH